MEGLEFYSDLKGWRSNGGSIPASIMTTEQRPDMVILDRRNSPNTIHMIELTVPFDSVTGIKKAQERKELRYAGLVEDIRGTGLGCYLHTLEVGARGWIDSRNKGILAFICHLAGVKKLRQVQKNCAKLALLGSRVIFNARNSVEWTGGDLLKP